MSQGVSGRLAGGGAVWLLCLGALLGCSGKEQRNNQPDGGGAQAITRIEVSPPGLLLTGLGQTHSLTARAFDAAGNEVPTTFVWTSSKPAQVSVSSTGTVQAVTALGSATIVAEADGAHSRPALVATVEAKPGTLLLTDAQVVSVGIPFASDGGEANLESEHDVVLRNVSVPAPGTVVLGTESMVVGGIVVSAQQQGSQVNVRLRSAALPELLARYDLDFTLPLADHEIVMEVEAAAPLHAPVPLGQRQPAYETKIEKTFPPKGNSPLKCTISGSASITGNVVSLKLNGDAKLVYLNSKNDATLGPNYLKLALEGPLTLKGTIGLKVEAGLEGEVKCELKGRIPIAAGPFALVIAPAIPIGVGVSLKGEVKLATFELALEGENGFDFKVGFECGPTPKPCVSLDKADPINKLTPKVTVPDQNKNFRVKLTAKAYFLSGLDLLVAAGLYDVQVIEATVGPVQEAKLAFPDAQADDRGYASNYELMLEGKVSPGSSVNKAIEKLMGEDPGELGAELTIGHDIAKSPAGTMSVDRTTTNPHKKVHFTFDFTPATVAYPVLGYNVERVDVYRKREDTPFYEFMQSVQMSSTYQATWDWTPENDDTGTNEFFAFVKTKMPVVVLELAADTGKKVEVVGICSASALADTGLPLLVAAAANGCSIAGHMHHTLDFDSDVASSHVDDTATVTMEVDPASSVPGLVSFKASGTWGITRSGRSGDCTLEFPPTSGTFSGAPEEGRIAVYTGEVGGYPPGLYTGAVATSIVTVTQVLHCPPPTGDISVTQPVADTVFLVTPDQNFILDLDGGVATGSYTQGYETFDWNLTFTNPGTSGGAAARSSGD